MPATSELKRAEADAGEVLRLDRLLAERDTALAQQTAHVRHLETLVAERERLVVERDAPACATRCTAHAKQRDVA